MTIHISRSGMVEDDDGFVSVTCDCGAVIGSAPDAETMLDMAMEHAWHDTDWVCDDCGSEWCADHDPRFEAP